MWKLFYHSISLEFELNSIKNIDTTEIVQIVKVILQFNGFQSYHFSVSNILH